MLSCGSEAFSFPMCFLFLFATFVSLAQPYKHGHKHALEATDPKWSVENTAIDDSDKQWPLSFDWMPLSKVESSLKLGSIGGWMRSSCSQNIMVYCTVAILNASALLYHLFLINHITDRLVTITRRLNNPRTCWSKLLTIFFVTLYGRHLLYINFFRRCRSVKTWGQIYQDHGSMKKLNLRIVYAIEHVKGSSKASAIYY